MHPLAELGKEKVSSEGLTPAAGVSYAKLRMDLSYLGSYGTRGGGYGVELLVDQISRVLGLTRHWKVALIGVGNLGHALARYTGFAGRGFQIAALFDTDPERIGEPLGGLTIRPMDDLATVGAAQGISIGVIATPAPAAQDVANRLVAAGAISNLTFP